MRKVVVGIDGSEGARAALCFAVAEASVRRLPLRVVSAWQVPATAVAGGIVPAVAVGDYEREAQHAAGEAVDEARRLDPDVDCAGSAVHAPAAAALVDATTPDDLLVVGSRGRGCVTGLLLGSVSRQVVHDARCPGRTTTTGQLAASPT